MSSLLEILVVLGLTLALGTVCRIMRVREDCAEVRSGLHTPRGLRLLMKHGL